MSTVQKFTFDLDFSEPDQPAEPEPETEADDEVEAEPEIEVPTFSEEDLEHARTEGHEAGREEGRRDAAAATEQRLVEGVDQLSEQLSQIIDTQHEANQEIAREMVSVAVGIAKKMFPDLNARNALGEIEKIVQETLNAINEEPRVQIFVHPDLREPFGERLAAIASKAGYDGKVFVNPDGSLDLGDCRIEWSNGSAIRDTAKLWEMVDEIIDRNLHGDPDDDVPPAADDVPATTDETPAPADETPADIDESPAPAGEAPTPAEEADFAEPENPDPVIETESEAENEPVPPVEDEPAPEMAATEAPSPETEDPYAGDPHAHEETPFAPHFEPEQDVGDAEKDDFNQDFVPSIGEETPTASADNAQTPTPESDDATDDNPAQPAMIDGDAMSQETTAAILEAQGSMHDGTDPSPPEDIK